MKIEKQSFLYNLIGHNTYNGFLEYAKPVVGIGCCVLAVLYTLSFFFHLAILEYLVSLTNGTSLLFIGFVLEIILLLDKRVDVEVAEHDLWNKQEKVSKPKTYKFTVIWGVALILLGVTAIYFSNKYRSRYSFECSTFLVDHNARIYHFDWNDDCENADEVESLEEMKGYQIGKCYSLCEWCKEACEDAEEEY